MSLCVIMLYVSMLVCCYVVRDRERDGESAYRIVIGIEEGRKRELLMVLRGFLMC